MVRPPVPDVHVDPHGLLGGDVIVLHGGAGLVLADRDGRQVEGTQVLRETPNFSSYLGVGKSDLNTHPYIMS